MEQAEYDTLVLSGGSVKGLMTLGSLQYLYDNFILNNIKNYVGTSSGAICCYLLIIGYTPIEIIVYICTNQLLEKMQHFNIMAMINGGGAISFNTIQEQLEKMTIEKIGKLMTLSDLKNKFNKNLICTTHNISTNSTVYIGPDNYPDLPCLVALRMSSNLPLVFESYKYNNNLWIDGGISDNFPIDKGCEIGNKILGLLTSSEKKEEENKSNEFNILEYVYTLMFIPVSQYIEYKINKISDNCNVIRLSGGKYKFFNFNISSHEKLDNFSEGYKRTKEYFMKD